MADFMHKEAKKETKHASKQNRTGIPAQLKQRMEQTSGFSFDDVRVHYNSDRPKKLDALAYTQGNQVYLGPGQERHLPHELGHVVQQKQGIVRPTERHESGVAMNTDRALERQADEIGAGKRIAGWGRKLYHVIQRAAGRNQRHNRGRQQQLQRQRQQRQQRQWQRQRQQQLQNINFWESENGLTRHFNDHGQQVGAQNIEDYAQRAHEFYCNRNQYQVKVDDEGIIRVYDAQRNLFGSYNPDGTTKTYFYLQHGQAYFDRQPPVSQQPQNQGAPPAPQQPQNQGT